MKNGTRNLKSVPIRNPIILKEGLKGREGEGGRKMHGLADDGRIHLSLHMGTQDK